MSSDQYAPASVDGHAMNLDTNQAMSPFIQGNEELVREVATLLDAMNIPNEMSLGKIADLVVEAASTCSRSRAKTWEEPIRC